MIDWMHLTPTQSVSQFWKDTQFLKSGSQVLECTMVFLTPLIAATWSGAVVPRNHSRVPSFLLLSTHSSREHPPHRQWARLQPARARVCPSNSRTSGRIVFRQTRTRIVCPKRAWKNMVMKETSHNTENVSASGKVQGSMEWARCTHLCTTRGHLTCVRAKPAQRTVCLSTTTRRLSFLKKANSWRVRI